MSDWMTTDNTPGAQQHRRTNEMYERAGANSESSRFVEFTTARAVQPDTWYVLIVTIRDGDTEYYGHMRVRFYPGLLAIRDMDACLSSDTGNAPTDLLQENILHHLMGIAHSFALWQDPARLAQLEPIWLAEHVIIRDGVRRSRVTQTTKGTP
jgi:hypothetical protein